MARILLVEDNADLAFGLRNNLEIEGHDVTVAEDGPTGLEHAVSGAPDLVLLDLMLPGMDGYRVLREIRSRGLEMPVLILTARGEEADKVLGFRIGADDYVTKPFGVLELLARVRALLRRSGTDADAANGVYEFGDVCVDPRARTVRRGPEEVGLTPKEFDLMLALIRREGAAATRIELLKEVWGHRAPVNSRTVDTHVAELRRKVEPVPGSPRFFLTVPKVGYRFRAS